MKKELLDLIKDWREPLYGFHDDFETGFIEGKSACADALEQLVKRLFKEEDK